MCSERMQYAIADRQVICNKVYTMCSKDEAKYLILNCFYFSCGYRTHTKFDTHIRLTIKTFGYFVSQITVRKIYFFFCCTKNIELQFSSLASN